jgi:5-(carboxyamino)imidazole ribonucleotide mutase
MGSKSDEGKLVESGFAEILQEILGGNEVVKYDVCSAHRNARKLERRVSGAVADGAEVFVGIAGMAAALPGAIAGLSDMTLPVIAVPLDKRGIDSCIYMPPGVPVLTAGVGIEGLKNAAIAVCQILALDPDDGGIRQRLNKYLEAANDAKPPEFDVNPLA